MYETVMTLLGVIVVLVVVGVAWQIADTSAFLATCNGLNGTVIRWISFLTLLVIAVGFYLILRGVGG